MGWSLGTLACAVIVCAACAGARTARPATVDWPEWGNTPQNTHFAALAQLNVSNVGRLRLAWTAPEGLFQFEFETFPIVVGTTMYYDTAPIRWWPRTPPRGA